MSIFETGQHRKISGEIQEQPQKRTRKTVEIKVGNELTDEHGNSYWILEKLGQGGVGNVFKVEDERLGLVRALKVLNTRARVDSKIIKRFNREIRLLARINNPFVLTAYDVAEFDIDGEKVLGLITDYIEGKDLDRILEENYYLPPQVAVVLAGEIAFALESMRELDIVHRDIKPKNILIQKLSDGTEIARVGDLGIASLTEDARIDVFRTAQENDNVEWAEAITEQGFIVGTIDYMSPESFRSELPDHRSDLYSFGITLYEILAGVRPFDCATLKDCVIAHQMEPPPTFEEKGIKDIPKWLENIVMKLLEKNKKDRYQTAADVYTDLREGVKKEYPELIGKMPFIWNVSQKPKT
ncbi:serine/threonine protein kinase [Candidatus Uhrbacteria bacterium]|nr:serine/threonine protein kinase [Candidatus Uhrbacteria bacterium]